MLTAHEGLLKAILDHPEDDVVRLVYADHLEECGQGERAEFIRVQIELASLPPERRKYVARDGDIFSFRRGAGEFVIGDTRPLPNVGERVDLELVYTERDGCKANWHGVVVTGVRRAGHQEIAVQFRVDSGSRPWPGEVLRRREEELWLAGRAYWGRCDGCGPLKDAANELSWWSRGFISNLTCTCADFMKYAGAIFSRHPVTKVGLSDVVVYPSGGNSTYYLGDLGSFPKEYWRQLEELPSRGAVFAALDRVCLDYGRQQAKLLQGVS